MNNSITLLFKKPIHAKLMNGCVQPLPKSLHLLRQRVKDSPEDLLGEQQLLLRRLTVTPPSGRQTVILPVLLVMIRQQL